MKLTVSPWLSLLRLSSASLAFFAATVSSWLTSAHAANVRVSDNPWREALLETVPTGFDPGGFSTEDFKVEWVGEAPTPANALSVRIVPGSIEWSRVSDSLLLPRVRLRIQTPADASGRLRYSGLQVLVSASPREGGTAETVVPLFGRNEIQLELNGNGAPPKTYRFKLKYAPRDGRSEILVDHTCSPFGVREDRLTAAEPFWAWIGCRPVHSRGEDQRSQLIQAYLVTDADTPVRLEGAELEEVAPGITHFIFEPGQKSRTFRTESAAFTLVENAKSKVEYGFLGVGLGPYRYTLESTLSDVDATAALVTLYGSYSLTDTLRITAFSGTAIHRQIMTDGGVYLNSESIRALDRRLSIYVMLGMNVIGVRLGDSFRMKFGAPQGIEASWRDFLFRNHSLNGGAFIYPKINNTAYYNLWVRYGKSGRFVELNYLNIRNELRGVPFFARAVGISFGMPLARFD